MDAVRRADAGDGGADVDLHPVAGDERLLGGRLEDVVAVGEGSAGPHQAPGDLPGQRAEEFRDPDAVAETAGGVLRLVRSGDPAGVLPAVSQQVQPDRAVLERAGAEVGRVAAQRPEGDPAAGTTDELDAETPGGQEA